MAYNKIGFHFGSQPNAQGYGDYIRALDNAGIPAVCMSMAGEGLGDIIACWNKGSLVEHTVVVRYMPPPGHPDGSQDVPRYDMTPEAAFVRFWAWMKPLIGDDVISHKDKIVIKVGNELEKEQAEWLAEFYLVGYEIAQSDPDGPFRLGAFGFASGEPEPEHWRGPRMLDYLRLCADDPIGASIVLHEYSYADTLQDGYPFLIGRFQDLFAACDENGIKRPYVYIHEWGWRQDVMPPVSEAMAQLTWAAQLYAQFPEVRGAGLWTLQGSGSYGNPHISKLAQPMIEPITNYTLAAEFPDPPNSEEPPMGYKAIIVKLPQDMTADEWRQAADTVFSLRHTMTASHDDMLVMLNGGNEESYVKFSHPERDLAAVDLVESAGYRWERLYSDPPTTPLEITDIVNELPKHDTFEYATRPLEAITTLTIHHTVSPPDRSIESIAAYHVDSKGWPGIGYHYMIKDDGRIFKTNYLTTKSYHAGTIAAPGDENYFSVGIALQGDFTNAPPPQAQQDAARELVANLRDNLPGVTAVLGHRQMPGAATQCPGNTWQGWLPYVADGEIVQPPPPPPPPTGKTVDITAYFKPAGQFGRYVVFHFTDGRTQPQQMELLPDGRTILFKGEGQVIDGQVVYDYEEMLMTEEGVRKYKDTSSGGRSAYDLDGVIWLPKIVEIGKVYQSSPTVRTFDRVNCQTTSSTATTDYIYVKELLPLWISPIDPSITFAEVLVCEWHKTPDINTPPLEIYGLAPDTGYVFWQDGAVGELPQGRQPLSFDLTDC